MTFYILNGLIILCSICIFFLAWSNHTQAKKTAVFTQVAMDHRAKAEFMIRELGDIFTKNNYKNKTYLCGILDGLAWEVGEKTDDQFTGWVMAMKHVNRKEGKR